MMSRPASSCALMAMMVASSCASARYGSGTRHSSRARTRGGKRPARRLPIDQPLRLRIAADQRGWKQHRNSSRLRGDSPLVHAPAPARSPAAEEPRGSIHRVDSEAAPHSPNEARTPSNCAAGRTACVAVCGVIDRHDDPQVRDLRIAHHVIDEVHRRVRHILGLQAPHPVLERLARETRIEFDAQRLVLGDAPIARIEARILEQFRRLQRRQSDPCQNFSSEDR